MPSLDGLRGFACLLVVLSHLKVPLGNVLIGNDFMLGSSGVLIFFSLSGFLMGTLYLEKNFTYEATSKYIVSRFSRITPAYYIAIFTLLVASYLISDLGYDLDALMIARSFAFLGSVGVFWSIPPEIQFYGFFLLIWMAYRNSKEGKHFFTVLVTVISVIFIATRDMWPGILLPSKFHIFLLGVGAAYLLHINLVKLYITHPFGQILIILSTLLYMNYFVTNETLYKDLILAALVGLTVASLSKSTFLTKVFELGFMRILGAASFSIYLFHEILIRVTDHIFDIDGPWEIRFLIYFSVALIPTIAFHYLVEKSLNQKSKDFGLRYASYFQQKFLKEKPASGSM